MPTATMSYLFTSPTSSALSPGLSALSPNLPSQESLMRRLTTSLRESGIPSRPAPDSEVYNFTSSHKYIDAVEKAKETGMERVRALEEARANNDGLLDRRKEAQFVPQAVIDYTRRIQENHLLLQKSPPGPSSFASRVNETRERIFALRQRMQQSTGVASSTIQQSASSVSDGGLSTYMGTVDTQDKHPIHPPSPIQLKPTVALSEETQQHMAIRRFNLYDDDDDDEDDSSAALMLTDKQKALLAKTIHAPMMTPLHNPVQPSASSTAADEDTPDNHFDLLDDGASASNAMTAPQTALWEKTLAGASTHSSQPAEASATVVTPSDAIKPPTEDSDDVDLDKFAPVTESQLNLFRRTLQAARSPEALVHAKVHEEQFKRLHGFQGNKSSDDEQAIRQRAMRILAGEGSEPTKPQRRSSVTRKAPLPVHLMDNYARMTLDRTANAGTSTPATASTVSSITTVTSVVSSQAPTIPPASVTASTTVSTRDSARLAPASSIPTSTVPTSSSDSSLTALRQALAIGSKKSHSNTNGLQKMETQLAAMLENKFKELTGPLDDDDDL